MSVVAGPLKNGWTIPPAAIGKYGTDYKFRAAIAFVGFGAGLRADGMYLLLVQDSTGKVLDGGKKYTLTFAQGQLPPVGAFWSVTMYQGHFLVPNSASKYSVSEWMNPKLNDDGSLTIYMQPTGPGADKELNWLPSSGSIPTPTPLMRLYWPLAPALEGTWSPAANVILTAVGYNLRLVLAWLRAFLRIILHALFQALATPSTLKPAC